MKSPVPDHMGHWLAGGAGLLVSLAIAQTGALAGQPEAMPWAAYHYYWLGWPLMCLAIYLITRRHPYRAWRWPLSMAVGQVFGVILLGGGSLVPVALVYCLLLSIPQFVVANRTSLKMLGSGLADEFSKDGDEPKP